MVLVVGFLLGGIGSFINVCAYRIPLESYYYTSLILSSCEESIPWSQNLPCLVGCRKGMPSVCSKFQSAISAELFTGALLAGCCPSSSDWSLTISDVF